VDRTIAATRTECSTIRGALLQLQDLSEQHRIGHSASALETTDSDTRAAAFEEYEAILNACSITFAVLNQRLEENETYSVDEKNRASSKAKLRALWIDDEMNLVRQIIQGQAIAVNLLVSAFQARVPCP
jgi:hypothetical protein